MPLGLQRYYGTRDLHFITSSCYRRQACLGTAPRRDLFLSVLERMRKRYQFVVVGYVVMPEHFHLLISEPQDRTPGTAMQALKLGFARRVLAQKRARRNPAQASLFEHTPQHVWQARFYDFNVWTSRKRAEKLRYMHQNPVKRGLVESPELWRWSSYRTYALGEAGAVRVNDCEILQAQDSNVGGVKRRAPAVVVPRSRKSRDAGAPAVWAVPAEGDGNLGHPGGGAVTGLMLWDRCESTTGKFSS